MMIVLIINLYTVRIVLNALGVEDYGIYNVVAGVVTMLNIISNVMVTAIQRFYSYCIGKNRIDQLRNIFSVSINICILVVIIVLAFGETVSLWFVNSQLVIPADRMYAANWIYQFSILSFITTIIQVPYSAAVIAHENIGIFAIITTIESVLKLIAAKSLVYLLFDTLIAYGATLLIIQVLVLLAYILIAHKKYIECNYQIPTEKKLYRDLLSFSGWSLFGSLAGVGVAQINTILVNIFFGPVVNTSRAIALQISAAINSFCNSFVMTIRPPIIQAYAGESYQYLNTIFKMSNKFIYYCLLMICVPLVIEMPTVLSLWLKVVDVQTVLFSRLIVVYSLILSINNPISIIIHATGHIKYYNLFVETVTILCIPATYILYKLKYPAYTTFVVMIVTVVISHAIRLICLKKQYAYFSYSDYFKSFVLPALVITLQTSVLALWIHRMISSEILRFFAVTIISLLSICLGGYFLGLSKVEKCGVKAYIHRLMRKKV